MKRGHYIGLDIAMEVSVACVVDQDGGVVQHLRFKTQEETLRGFLEGVPRPRHFVVEATTQADWAFRIAREVCDKAVICKLFKRRELSGERKGDDEDAYNLAQKLRKNDVIEVWVDADKRRKDLMQYALTYQALVKETTREKNRIRAVFRGEGLRGAQAAYEPSTREEALLRLPLDGERQRAKTYGVALDCMMDLRKKAWAAFYKEVKKYTLFKRLLETPAFGNVSAAMATAIIWDPERFKDKRHFWSYCGFSLRVEESGEFYIEKKTGRIRRKEKRFTLGLTREHNRAMKVLFKRAALALLRKQWREEFQRLRSNGVSKENATLTLARKVAAISLHLAKYGGNYDETKVFMKH